MPSTQTFLNSLVSLGQLMTREEKANEDKETAIELNQVFLCYNTAWGYG